MHFANCVINQDSSAGLVGNKTKLISYIYSLLADN